MTTTIEGEPTVGDDRPLLNDTVQTLSEMIKDLEKQLEKMLTVNGALERDLDKEKKKTADMVVERDRFKERAGLLEEDLISLEDLRAENGHLESERSRLVATIEEIGRQLADAAQENMKLDRTAERMRIERDDAVEELQSVEAQFDHAMEVATDLKDRVTTLAEERDELVDRLKASGSQLKMTEEQRDSLRTEVDESRKALDEIRREVADACMVSQRFYYQEEENK